MQTDLRKIHEQLGIGSEHLEFNKLCFPSRLLQPKLAIYLKSLGLRMDLIHRNIIDTESSK